MVDIHRYNHKYASAKNRVEHTHLILKLAQMERDSSINVKKLYRAINDLEQEIKDAKLCTGSATQTNSDIFNDIQPSIKLNTKLQRKNRILNVKSRPSLDKDKFLLSPEFLLEKNNQTKYEQIVAKLDKQIEQNFVQSQSEYNQKEFTKPDTNMEPLTKTRIKQLCKRDSLFGKRFIQLQVSKRVHKPVTYEGGFRIQISKAVVINGLKELLEKAKNPVSPRDNPYANEQIKISDKVVKYV